MKSFLIWAITMALITVIFGVKLGFIPGLILSSIITDLVNRSENKKAEKSLLQKGEMVECPKCHTINKITNEFCRECGESLSQINRVNQDIKDAETLEDISHLKTDDSKKGSVLSEENKSNAIVPKRQNTRGENNKQINETDKIISKENVSSSDKNKETNKKTEKKERGKQPIQTKDVIIPKSIQNASSTIRFCRKCGTQLDEGVMFCRKCGTKISE